VENRFGPMRCEGLALVAHAPQSGSVKRESVSGACSTWPHGQRLSDLSESKLKYDLELCVRFPPKHETSEYLLLGQESFGYLNLSVTLAIQDLGILRPNSLLGY